MQRKEQNTNGKIQKPKWRANFENPYHTTTADLYRTHCDISMKTCTKKGKVSKCANEDIASILGISNFSIIGLLCYSPNH